MTDGCFPPYTFGIPYDCKPLKFVDFTGFSLVTEKRRLRFFPHQDTWNTFAHHCTTAVDGRLVNIDDVIVQEAIEEFGETVWASHW